MPVTPARFVRTLVSRSPGRGLVRGSRIVIWVESLERGQECRDLGRYVRADFDLQLDGVAEGLGLEAELALAVDTERTRFARLLVALHPLAEWRSYLAQGLYAPGVGVVMPCLVGGTGSGLGLPDRN